MSAAVMRATDIARAVARMGSAAVVLLAASPASAWFGGVDPIPACASFTTCTAAVGSSAWAGTGYRFSNIGPFYPIPTGLNPVVDGVSDTWFFEGDVSLSTTPATTGGWPCNVACYTNNPFTSTASARAQSGFAVNRAAAESGFGANGEDYRSPNSFADVRVTTLAQAGSVWRDAWTFSGDGHFSATVGLEGVSSNRTGANFPSSYTHNGLVTSGDWFFEFMVWDVDHLSFSEYFEETPGPTLVTRVLGSGNNEQRASFTSALALDFDFVSGVQYVVTSQLGVNARYGRTIDLYNTARLQEVALSGGASMLALSGHDYLAPVPEPVAPVLLLAGLLVMVRLGHVRRPA